MKRRGNLGHYSPKILWALLSYLIPNMTQTYLRAWWWNSHSWQWSFLLVCSYTGTWTSAVSFTLMCTKMSICKCVHLLLCVTWWAALLMRYIFPRPHVVSPLPATQDKTRTLIKNRFDNQQNMSNMCTLSLRYMYKQTSTGQYGNILTDLTHTWSFNKRISSYCN